MTDSFTSSQESDYFPPELKLYMKNPEVDAVINCVQLQHPFEACDEFMLQNQTGDDQEVYSTPTDTNIMFQPPAQTPSPTSTMLSTEEYPGPFGFELMVNSEHSGKNWMFSYDLNKLYIVMNSLIHLSFKCTTFPQGYYIRVLPVFSDCEHFQESVVRCMHHRAVTNKQNEGLPLHQYNHVVWIEHHQVFYEYDESSERYSVRVALDNPQAGTDWVNVAVKFMCKNSCISGMNRRPIEVIFTLEDYGATVYGRQKMKVRICSCPKRDKQKEEEDAKGQSVPRGKRLMKKEEKSEHNTRPTKQRKLDDPYMVPALDMDHYLELLNTAYSNLKFKLRKEKRQATEKENTLLQRYENELNTNLGEG